CPWRPAAAWWRYPVGGRRSLPASPPGSPSALPRKGSGQASRSCGGPFAGALPLRMTLAAGGRLVALPGWRPPFTPLFPTRFPFGPSPEGLRTGFAKCGGGACRRLAAQKDIRGPALVALHRESLGQLPVDRPVGRQAYVGASHLDVVCAGYGAGGGRHDRVVGAVN